MIDLHCHLLPGIDDGAKHIGITVEMAQIAVADGIHTMACTPHIYPGMYMNDTAGIRQMMIRVQAELDGRGIPLKLVIGADVHLVPRLVEGIRMDLVPTLNGTRYLLLEPSHTTPPPGFEEQIYNLIASGYVPVITHPERLLWVGEYYQAFMRLIRMGAWMQITAGSLTGLFGPKARYWAERFLHEGHTHILATDAHSATRRVPVLSEAREVAERALGAEEADNLVLHRPQAILDDLPPDHIPLPDVSGTTSLVRRGAAWWSSLWRRARPERP
jgi:protein-tyrosine phosphatase